MAVYGLYPNCPRCTAIAQRSRKWLLQKKCRPWTWHDKQSLVHNRCLFFFQCLLIDQFNMQLLESLFLFNKYLGNYGNYQKSTWITWNVWPFRESCPNPTTSTWQKKKKNAESRDGARGSCCQPPGRSCERVRTWRPLRPDGKIHGNHETILGGSSHES